MDATLAAAISGYLLRTTASAGGRDARAGAARGGAVSVLWHNDRFDPAYARGWDRAYDRLLGWVRERGGRLCTAAEAVGLDGAATPRR